MNIIMQFIPDFKSIKSETLTKLCLWNMQGWTKLWNLQEPYIWSSSLCVVFAARGSEIVRSSLNDQY